MHKSGIYCIENQINNKRYIGQTKDIERRENEHFRELKGNYHYNDHLQRAFNRYGLDSFKFTILEKCAKELLDDREAHYIKKYNTLDKTKGYNLRVGGHKPKLSKISRAKISRTRRKRLKEGKIIPTKHKWTDEQKRGLSKARSKSYEVNPEIKEKISEAKATVSTEEVRRIKMFLYMDMDINEIAGVTGAGFNVVYHIDQGTTFKHILPELNYYIKNRYVINKQKQISRILKQYREGRTYQQMAETNGIHKRTAIRIVKANKEPFDEHMRDKAISFERNKRHSMARRMYKSGWNTVEISKHFRMSRVTIAKILKGEH